MDSHRCQSKFSLGAFANTLKCYLKQSSEDRLNGLQIEQVTGSNSPSSGFISIYDCINGTSFSKQDERWPGSSESPLSEEGSPEMKTLRRTPAACVAVALFCASLSYLSPFASGQTAADNSGQNKNQTFSADNQSSAKADRMITAHIRKAIIADKELSTYGHNVKIITVNGAVTLKGPVKSEEEKQRIASDASGVVSSDAITNALTVKQD